MISAINLSNYGMNVFRSEGGNKSYKPSLDNRIHVERRSTGRAWAPVPTSELLVPQQARKTKTASFSLTADG
jgi:hypothetical protein